VLVTEDEKLKLRTGGTVRDIAPTLLGVIGETAPTDMTGTDLQLKS